MIEEPLPLDEKARRALVKADKDRLIIYLGNEIIKMFGPPPIVRGESRNDFLRILYGVISDKCPKHNLDKMHVWDIATSIFLGRRLDLVTRKALDRRIEEELKVQKQRRKDRAKQAENKKEADEALAEIKSAPDLTAAQKREDELTMVVDSTVQDTEKLMDRAEAEAAHAKAFEQAMPFMRNLDDMKSRNFFRRNISIEMWLTKKPVILPAVTALQLEQDSRFYREYQRDWMDQMFAADQQSEEAQPQGQVNPAKVLTVLPTDEAAKTSTAPNGGEAADAPSPTENGLKTPAAHINKTVDKPTDPDRPHEKG